MKQSSVDALIHTGIIMGVIAGLPLLAGLLCITFTELLWTNPTNVPIEWIRTEDITGGSPVNPFTIIWFIIVLIASSIGIYLESKQSIETKKEDKK